MSYIAKKGRAAAESAMQEGGGKDFSKALVSFKSGTEYKVRVPSTEDFVEFFNHSVFKVFYSCPCTKKDGEPDLYDSAVDLLYKDAEKAKKAGKEKEAEELRNKAYQLKAKPRYLFGFYNLEDGQPIIVDVSKKQAQVIISSIDKFYKKIGKTAFELSKSGSGQSTTVSLLPVLDLDDLSDKERKNFEETKDKEFPEELYEKVLRIKPIEEQVEDLKNFGFDVGRLGIQDEEVTPIENETDPAVNF